jgi:hypothetical protein
VGGDEDVERRLAAGHPAVGTANARIALPVHAPNIGRVRTEQRSPVYRMRICVRRERIRVQSDRTTVRRQQTLVHRHQLTQLQDQQSKQAGTACACFDVIGGRSDRVPCMRRGSPRRACGDLAALCRRGRCPRARTSRPTWRPSPRGRSARA